MYVTISRLLELEGLHIRLFEKEKNVKLWMILFSIEVFDSLTVTEHQISKH